MSDPVAKASRSKAKDKRQGVAPLRERPQKRNIKTGIWCKGKVGTPHDFKPGEHVLKLRMSTWLEYRCANCKKKQWLRSERTEKDE